MRKLLKSGGAGHNSSDEKNGERRSSAVSRRGMEALRVTEENRDLLLRYFAARGAKNRGAVYW
jgi:hypothetical protein